MRYQLTHRTRGYLQKSDDADVMRIDKTAWIDSAVMAKDPVAQALCGNRTEIFSSNILFSPGLEKDPRGFMRRKLLPNVSDGTFQCYN